MSNRHPQNAADKPIELRKERSILTKSFPIQTPVLIETPDNAQHVTRVVIVREVTEQLQKPAITGRAGEEQCADREQENFTHSKNCPSDGFEDRL